MSCVGGLIDLDEKGTRAELAKTANNKPFAADKP
jgi:hypothetical protein